MKDIDYISEEWDEQAIAKGGVAVPFPWRLHEMLKVAEEEGMQDIVSWAPHGRAFTVHKPKDFADRVLTRFFSQTKYPSFQRQLNLYGFNRFSHGPDKGAYYHYCFIRGHRNLVRNMIRKKIKGTKVRRTPKEEPNFYDPAWKSHFGYTIPENLKKTAFNVVAPPATTGKKQVAPRSNPVKKPKTPTAVMAPTTAPPAAVPYVDILPAPTNYHSPVVQVSDEESSGDSLDLDELDAAMDGDLLLFEGNTFHFLDGEDFVTDIFKDTNNQNWVDQVSSYVPL